MSMFEYLDIAIDSAIKNGSKYSDARILFSKTRNISAKNGEVENFNKALKRRSQIAKIEGRDWRKELESFLLDYRTTPHSVTKTAPANVLFRRETRNGIPAYGKTQIRSQIDKDDDAYKKKTKEREDEKRRIRRSCFTEGDLVLVKNMKRNDKLSPPWLPNTHTIIKVYERSLLLESNNGKRYVRAKQLVKPFKGINDEKKRLYDDEEDDDDILFPIPDHDTTPQEEETAVEEEEAEDDEEDDDDVEDDEENDDDVEDDEVEENEVNSDEDEVEDDDENENEENEEVEDGGQNIVAGTRIRRPPERLTETYSH